ncbi:MAG: hypothetical protein ABIL62_18760 [Planctomycetota bacterium]
MKSSKFKVPNFSGPNEEYRKVQESMKQLSKKLQEIMTPVEEIVRRVREAIAEDVQKISEVIAPIVKRIAEFPDKTKRVLKNLAEKGWFLPLDITRSAVDHLAKLIESNDGDEINRFMVEFYTIRLDEVLDSLVAAFPERSHLFRTAFKAHNRKEYDLSIPVLLAQADGVCYDMLGVDLFGRNHKNPKIPKTKEALESKIGSTKLGPVCANIPIYDMDGVPLVSSLFVRTYDAFFEPLRSGSALMLNKNQMKEKRDSIPGYNVLNRHEIMHGIDTHYGSEVNSLKAIAQLDYLRCIRESSKDYEKWKEQLHADQSPESQIVNLS